MKNLFNELNDIILITIESTDTASKKNLIKETKEDNQSTVR